MYSCFVVVVRDCTLLCVYDFGKIIIARNLKAQCHLLSNVILRFYNNIIIIYFDCYLYYFGIKIQIILINLYKLKIQC